MVRPSGRANSLVVAGAVAAVLAFVLLDACSSFDASDRTTTVDASDAAVAESSSADEGGGDGGGASAEAGRPTCSPGAVVTPTIEAETNSGGIVCYPKAEGVLPALLGQGVNAMIAENNVNGCVRANFGARLPLDLVKLTIARESTTACGVSCQGEPCGEGLHLFTYEPATASYVEIKRYLDLVGPTLDVPVSTPDVQIVIICRDHSGAGAIRLDKVVGRCRS